MAEDVKAINDGWAHVAYKMRRFEPLRPRRWTSSAAQAALVVARYPGKAEPLLWQGIVAQRAGQSRQHLPQAEPRQRARAI